MERSNGGNGGISGKVAATLGILYSIGVVAFFTYYTSLFKKYEDPDSKISLLRFTYYIFCEFFFLL